MNSVTVMAGILALTLVACGEETPRAPVPKAAQAPTPAAPAPQAKAPPAPVPAPAAPVPPSADQLLADRVKAALRAQRGINADGIDVTVKDGTVTLFGTTETKMKRETAAKAAAAVAGVKSVENKLAVVAGS